MEQGIDCNSIIVRNVTRTDMRKIWEIYSDEVLNGVSSWEELPPSLDELTARQTAIVSQGYPYCVAERNGEIVGYAYVSSYRPRSGYRYTVENTVYVDRQVRGYGVGRRLIDALIDNCTALGYRQMIAVIGDSHNESSISFHTRMGFTRSGVIKSIGFKFGRWMDSVIMQRPLGDGGASLPSDK